MPVVRRSGGGAGSWTHGISGGHARRSATFHFLLLSARAILCSPADWGIYAEQLTVLTNLLEDGRLHPPQVRNVGPLSVASVRHAHRLLEDGHVQGKLVMTM
jgi:NADPH:quinone reductase-like Zn-dependent oxidoreductase